MATTCLCGCGEVPPVGKRYIYTHYSRSSDARQMYNRRRDPAIQGNTSGLCLCGCGGAAPIATMNRPHRGYYKGQYMWYILGHQSMRYGPDKIESWKGGRRIDATGYVLVYAPGHPRANKGYMLEHRLVMERHLGRPLVRSESVHHINGIKTDNRLENLVLITQSSHMKLHGVSGLEQYHRDHPEACSEGGKKGSAARWHPRP